MTCCVVAGSVSTHHDLAELSAFNVFARKECLDHSLQANVPFVNVQGSAGKNRIRTESDLIEGQ